MKGGVATSTVQATIGGEGKHGSGACGRGRGAKSGGVSVKTCTREG
jgi:hypothetical protein